MRPVFESKRMPSDTWNILSTHTKSLTRFISPIKEWRKEWETEQVRVPFGSVGQLSEFAKCGDDRLISCPTIQPY